MKQIVKNGNTYKIAEMDSVTSALPVGTYNLCFSERGGFYLEKTNDFELPDKIYGDMSIVDRSIAVYRERKRNFGLMLSGLRGAGKSLTMKKIAIELNQPIIIVNESYSDVASLFIKFITDPVLGDCTIIFDEFEKKFREEDVTPLTLLDGPYTNHHFFILTVNEKHVNENLMNRPGRIYYHKEYGSIEDEMVEEVGLDLLNDKTMINDLINTCSEIRHLSFDMLISIINDCNTFSEAPSKCVKYFGFEKHGGSYVNVHQKIGNSTRQCNKNPIWVEPKWKRLWVENIMLETASGEPFYLNEYIDIDKLVKVAPKKYKLEQELTYHAFEDCEIDENTLKQIVTQKIELYINIDVQPKFNYVF